MQVPGKARDFQLSTQVSFYPQVCSLLLREVQHHVTKVLSMEKKKNLDPKEEEEEEEEEEKQQQQQQQQQQQTHYNCKHCEFYCGFWRGEGGEEMNKGGRWVEWQKHISLDGEIVVSNPGPNRHHGPSMGRQRKTDRQPE